jgi:glutaredoxin
MEIPKPNQGEITVYSKSGCANCVNVKKLLKDNNMSFSVVNCDEFLYEDKEGFLECIKELAGKEYRMFPMVFDGSTFIGGFAETGKYLEKKVELDFGDSNF